MTNAGSEAASAPPDGRQTPGAVFLAFLVLGLTSFGGPIAHLGYFRAEFVERRRWLDEQFTANGVDLTVALGEAHLPALQQQLADLSRGRIILQGS